MKEVNKEVNVEEAYRPLNILRGLQDEIDSIITQKNAIEFDIKMIEMHQRDLDVKIREFKKKWHEAVQDPSIWSEETDNKNQGG